jgi:hypothetical protein
MSNPVRAFRTLLILSMLLTGTGLLQAAPTTRPAAKATNTTDIRVDASGRYLHKQKPMALFAMMRLLQSLKNSGRPQGIRVTVDPRAPYRKVLVLQTLLKESKLPFETRMLSPTKAGAPTSQPARSAPQAATRPAPARRVSPRPVAARPVVPRVAPRVAPRPVAQAAAPRAVPNTPAPTQVDWNKVPSQTVKALQGPRKVELRLLAVDAAGKGISAALTGLVFYKGTRRRPVGRQATNDKGYARYIFHLGPNSPTDFRVAVLNDTHLYEFPVPLKRVSNGLLYLRMTLDPKKGGRKTMPRKVAIRPVAKVKLPPIQSLQWSKAPLSKNLRGKKGKLVEFRIQLIVDGKPLVGAPTGLLLGRGKQRGTPIGRLRGDKQGRLRYQVLARPGIWYGLAVMVDANNPSPRSLKLRSLPLPKSGETVKYVRMRFSTKKRAHGASMRGKTPRGKSPHSKSAHGKAVTNKTGNFLFQGFHLLAEPFDPYHIRITTFVTLLRPMGTNFQKMPQLPLSWGAKKTKLGPQLGKLSPEIKGLFIVTRRLPAKPRLQLSYSYLVPIDTTSEEIRIKVRPDYGIVRGSLFLHPKLGLKTDLGKKIRDIKSRGKRKQVYGLYALSKARKGKFVVVSLKSKTPYQRGFVGWVKRTYKSRRRYKLLGLGVIFTFSVLGLFLLVGGGRREEESVTLNDETDSSDTTESIAKTDETDEKSAETDETDESADDASDEEDSEDDSSEEESEEEDKKTD